MGKVLFKLFIKNHENTSDPKVREGYGKLAGITGIISNLLLCIIKISIGIFSKSIAIIADGINNLADASSSMITLVGFKLAAAPEDKDHPYGHARIEYLAGLFVSVFIIVIGLRLLTTSIDKIIHPEPVVFSIVTVVILIVAILIKLWQAAFYREAGRRIDSVALTATATDSRNDVISTTAVLISLLIGHLTGYSIDGYMGCLVALFITWSGIQLVKETSSPLLGEAPDDETVKSILTIIRKEPGILGVHDLMVHNYGPGKVFASAHVEVDADGDLMESHDMIDNIERLVSESLKIHFVVHMDPVKVNDPVINKMRSIIMRALDPITGVESLHDFRIVPGPTHTNLIFDVVLTSECVTGEEEITAIANAAAKRENENYYVVITYDKAYTNI
ncbi:MAG: cation diffusion facilitator family transporter [Bacillota bacterium]|nr:cation diffusion facilitator family transporter [Bacillota bacterium]